MHNRLGPEEQLARFHCEVSRWRFGRVRSRADHRSESVQGRQYPGEVIVTAVRWYLRYPLAYEHVSELLAERGLSVDGSCVWRWIPAYSPELSKRCRQHLRATNKSCRVDETYSALSSVLLRRVEVPLALG
jgi:hypothetical protein